MVVRDDDAQPNGMAILQWRLHACMPNAMATRNRLIDVTATLADVPNRHSRTNGRGMACSLWHKCDHNVQ